MNVAMMRVLQQAMALNPDPFGTLRPFLSRCASMTYRSRWSRSASRPARGRRNESTCKALIFTHRMSMGRVGAGDEGSAYYSVSRFWMSLNDDREFPFGTAVAER